MSDVRVPILSHSWRPIEGGSEPPSTDRRAWELYEWLDQEAEDVPSGDMIGTQNDRKPGVLMNLPASSTGAVILANEAIVVIAHPNRDYVSKHDSRAIRLQTEPISFH
jgi:hypothetical protein